MRRKMSKVISVLMIMTLVFTSGSFAFADTPEGKVKSEAETTKEAFDGSIEKEGKRPATEQSVTNTPMLKSVKTGNEKMTPAVLKFNDNNPISNAPGKKGHVKSYKLKKGTVIWINARNEVSTASGAVTFGVFSNKELTAGSYFHLYRGNKRSAVIEIPKTGTYWVGAYATTSAGSYKYDVDLYAGKVSPGNRKISNKKYAAIAHTKSGQVNYFKFKAPKTGYVKVGAGTSGTLTLCKSNKKALSNAVSLNNNYTYFGVKKGTTYYVRVKANYPSTMKAYQVRYANGKISEKSGSKQSKAVKIKRKKTKKGTITAGSSRNDWYKFKVPTNNRVTLTMKGRTNKQMKVKLILKKGSHTVTKTFNYTNLNSSYKNYMTYFKGYTCYIKVSRADKYSSGWYSFKWNY